MIYALFDSCDSIFANRSTCVLYLHMCFVKRYKGKAAVGTVPSMEKVYHLLIAGTIAPDDKGVS